MNLSKYNGVTYSVAEFNKCGPTRKDFIDTNINNQIIQDVQHKKNILFLPNEIEDHYDKNILMVGTLESGAKASVLLTGVPHFFDLFPGKMLNDEIEIPKILNLKSLLQMNDLRMTEFVELINKMREDNIGIIRYEVRVGSLYILGRKKYIYVRLIFEKKSKRAKALKNCYAEPAFFVASNYSKTTSIFSLYDKYTGIWMELTKYKLHGKNGRGSTKLDYNFELLFDDFIKVTDPVQLLKPGHNMIFTFDIETCEVKPEDELEVKQNIVNEYNQIFNIRVSVADTATPGKELLSIGLFRPAVEKCIQLESHGLNIMCKTQKELLLCFGRLFECLQPDVLVTYNGNGFDIPVILMQARIEGIFDQFYCMTSPRNTDVLHTYNEYVPEIGYYANKGGYTFWSKIHTTKDVSGLTSNSEYKAQLPLRSFKIENGRDDPYHYWKPLGCINIDLLMICKQSFKKATSFKLSDMLKRKKIPESKHDLSYAEIWKRWKNSANYFTNPNSEQLRELTEIDVYCAQDCYCTYLLLCSFRLFEQKRSMCKYTSLPMESVIYYADGNKVVNGIMRLCATKGYCFIEQFISQKYLPNNSDHLKYHKIPQDAYNQGAIVNILKTGKVHIIHEKYGEIMKPVEAIDAQSLYPNIIIIFNLSPEMITCIRPDDIENYKEYYLPDLPQEIIDEFNIINNTIWIFDHKNDPSKYGIIPTYLNELFNDRKKVKARTAELREHTEKIREEFTNKYTKSEFLKDKQVSKLEADKLYNEYVETNIDAEYHSILQTIYALDAEQLTIKIKMNTVYGCMKYSKNPLFFYLIAHMTTWFGRNIITKANEIVISLGCTPCYNDTDSVYFYHNPKLFEDIFDKGIKHPKFRKRMVNRSIKLSLGRAKLIEWYTNKYFAAHKDEKPKYLKYEELVKLTTDEKYHQKVLNIPAEGFNDIFNKRMSEFTKGPNIVFVREETLFPACFLMKKKYFGQVHESLYSDSLTKENILVKGISSVSRNTTLFARDFIVDTMLEILNTDEIDIENIVFEKMKKLYLINHELEKYCKCFTYRPSVNNITVKEFVNRMKQLSIIDPNLYKVPDPLEILKLVLTKQTSYINLNSTNKSQKKSELYEYIDVIKNNKLVIDREHNLRSLYAFCAQLLTYKRFEYFEESMEINTYKDMVQKKYVIPYFEDFINQQEHIISLKTLINHTKIVLKSYIYDIKKYFYDKYPEVYDLIHLIINSSGYDSAYLKIKKLSSKPLKSKIDSIGFAVMSRTKKYTCLNTTELLYIEKEIIPKYELFVNNLYAKLEKTFIDIVIKFGNTGIEPDLSNLDVLTQAELDILSELRKIIVIYINCYKYYVSITAAC